MKSFLVDNIKGEDTAGFISCSNFSVAFVADGAFDIQPGMKGGAADLASKIKQGFYRLDKNKEYRNVVDLVRDVLLNLNLIYPNIRGTSTLSVIFRAGGLKQILLLGDSPLILKDKTIEAKGFDDGYEADLMNRIDSKIESGIPRDEAYFLFKDELISRRENRNKKHGSGWLIGRVPGVISNKEAVDAILNNATIINVSADEKCVVLTDGAYRCVEYGLISIEEFIRKCYSGDVKSEIDKLREAEKRDSNREKWTRFSIHDDASVAWV